MKGHEAGAFIANKTYDSDAARGRGGNPAAVIDDGGVGASAVDVETLAGTAARTGEALGMEQIEEFLTASLLVHQGDDREVHEVGTETRKISQP